MDGPQLGAASLTPNYLSVWAKMEQSWLLEK